MTFGSLDEPPILPQAMFRRRLAGYSEMGYRIEMPQHDAFGLLS